MIEREVEIYRVHEATVRLERYPEMDALVEVEGDPDAIERAIVVTGIPRRRLHRRGAERVRAPVRGADRRRGPADRPRAAAW